MKVNKSDCSFGIIVRNVHNGWLGWEGKPADNVQIQDTSQTVRGNHWPKLAKHTENTEDRIPWIRHSEKEFENKSVCCCSVFAFALVLSPSLFHRYVGNVEIWAAILCSSHRTVFYHPGATLWAAPCALQQAFPWLPCRPTASSLALSFFSCFPPAGTTEALPSSLLL